MARRLNNPVFFVLLAITVVLWYIIKLGETYTAEIVIPAKIEDTQYPVRCTVEGIGYDILFYKIRPRLNTVVINPDNVNMLPSAVTPGAFSISSFSLQNAISRKISDLKILSVDSTVDIHPSKQEE